MNMWSVRWRAATGELFAIRDNTEVGEVLVLGVFTSRQAVMIALAGWQAEGGTHPLDWYAQRGRHGMPARAATSEPWGVEQQLWDGPDRFRHRKPI
jgi:hypothetical protein